MQIQATFVQPISATESFVEIIVADHEIEEEAEAHIRWRCTIEHSANPLMAEIQQAALRYAQDAINAQLEGLAALVSKEAQPDTKVET
jgi:hypothetical protein